MLAAYCLTTLLAFAPAPDSPKPQDPIAAAVNHQDRAQEDRERDKTSKPSALLAFTLVKPGMQVADIFAGKGYFSELFAHVVGTQGKVYAHNNQAYMAWIGSGLLQRLSGDRLSQVTILKTETEDMQLPKGELDLVLLSLGYHDVFYADPENGWPVIDREGFLKQIYDALKPGGVFVVTDHTAVAGSKDSVAHKLHRIEPAFARKTLEDAGFIFEAEGDFLANPDDKLDLSAFDPAIRGKTDRFAFRFRKPK